MSIKLKENMQLQKRSEKEHHKNFVAYLGRGAARLRAEDYQKRQLPRISIMMDIFCVGRSELNGLGG